MIEQGIPKIIHYCWFGGGELPDKEKKCIESWKKYMPDYEIREWNESNYDIENCCNYVKEAYLKKKWAFVSDYVRFDVVYRYGGIYFDTDVEMIQSIEDLLNDKVVLGAEKTKIIREKRNIKYELAVAVGLVLGAPKENSFCQKILESYKNDHFIIEGREHKVTVVERVTGELLKQGYDVNCYTKQTIDGIDIYPPEYFSPLNPITGKMELTLNSRTIHHYAGSWCSPIRNTITKITRKYYKYPFLERTISLPFRVVDKIQTMGIKGLLFDKK